MRRTKEEAAITRERLLDAALESFHTKGYSATTLDDIARQAGITRGAIHWHFGSKAELFNTVIRERYMQAGANFAAILAEGGTPLQLLRQILIKWLTYVEEDSKFRMMLEMLMLKTEVSAELAEGMQEKRQSNRFMIGFFADLIRKGIDSGELRADVNPEIVAIAALGTVNGVTSIWLTDSTVFSLRAAAEETVDIFLQGVVQQ
jgi:AcrR family transcriptional regulator